MAAALAAALTALALRAAVRRVAASLRARRRARVAAAGERHAEGLLEGLGYRVVERQCPTTWSVEVDGAPEEVSLRADLLVERGGRCLVAEVKTGARLCKHDRCRFCTSGASWNRVINCTWLWL